MQERAPRTWEENRARLARGRAAYSPRETTIFCTYLRPGMRRAAAATISQRCTGRALAFKGIYTHYTRCCCRLTKELETRSLKSQRGFILFLRVYARPRPALCARARGSFRDYVNAYSARPGLTVPPAARNLNFTPARVWSAVLANIRLVVLRAGDWMDSRILSVMRCWVERFDFRRFIFLDVFGIVIVSLESEW